MQMHMRGDTATLHTYVCASAGPGHRFNITGTTNQADQVTFITLNY